MINHFHPNSTMNFDEACDKAGIPVISHETGQFQTYPDYLEMKKYTGVLHPYNFEILDYEEVFGNANHLFIIQYPVFKDKSMYDRRNDNARAVSVIMLWLDR